MTDPWMKLGGCAALTAVDSCIYFTLFCGGERLCPIDVSRLNKDSYKEFAMAMKPYIRPRHHGVSKLSLYADGMKAYLASMGNDSLRMDMFPAGQELSDAEKALAGQIDREMVVPFLLLNPRTREWSEYRWHWFLLTGYRRDEKGLFVKAVTYGEAEWLSFAGLWDDRNENNGGMILYDFRQEDTDK